MTNQITVWSIAYIFPRVARKFYLSRALKAAEANEDCSLRGPRVVYQCFCPSFELLAMISNATDSETQLCCAILDVTLYPRLNDQVSGKSWLMRCLVPATFSFLRLRTRYEHRYHCSPSIKRLELLLFWTGCEYWHLHNRFRLAAQCCQINFLIVYVRK